MTIVRFMSTRRELKIEMESRQHQNEVADENASASTLKPCELQNLSDNDEECEERPQAEDQRDRY